MRVRSQRETPHLHYVGAGRGRSQMVMPGVTPLSYGPLCLENHSSDGTCEKIVLKA